MIRLGLISRIALLVVCVEVAAFGALGWFYIDRFSTAADAQLRSRLQVVGRMIANDELAVSIISRQSLMGDLVHAPYLNGMVIGGNGRVIVATNPAHLGRLASGIPDFDARLVADSAPDEQFVVGKDTLTSITQIHGASGGAPIYRTVITVSTAELNAQKRSIAMWGQLGSALFILLSSTGIVLIAQRLITRRVQASLAVLKEVENGALDARIPVSSDDELGQLQHGINSMTAKVGALLNQHRRNEEELATILNAIGDGVIAVGPDGGILNCNPSAAAFLGGSPDSLENGRVAELLPELFGKDHPCWWSTPESLTRQSRVSIERTGPDGSPRSIELGHGPIIEPDGTVVGAVLVLQDVTEHRQAERALAKNRKILRTMIDSATMWIAYFGPEGRYIVANRRYSETFGLPLEKIEGAHFTEVLPPAMAQGQRPYIERCLAGETVTFTEAFDVGAAEPIYTTGTYVPVFDDTGHVIGGVLAASDISPLKRTEQALRDLNAALEQRVREQTEENLVKERLLLQQSRHAAMGEMVSAIAHQWRQPLNALALTLGNLKDSFDFGELDQACLDSSMETAHGLIQKMSATIDDFRNFFRTKQRKEKFSLAAAIRDAAKLLQPSLMASEVELVLDCTADMENFGSANEFGQVLVNLIVNAKEAAIERKVNKPRIVVKLERTGENALISVEDNAGGIDPGVGDRIFDPYFTTKSMGTGIGLYMARIIIERHMDGSIAYTNLEHGTRFTLTLPLREPSAEELREAEA